MKRLAALAAVSAIAISGVAVAANAARTEAEVVSVPVARIAASDGLVQVDRGEGFADAGVVATLRPGELALTSSASELVYADGCTVTVAAMEPIEVLAASPCMQDSMLHRASLQTEGGAGAGGFGSAMAGSTGLLVGGVFVVTAIIVGSNIGDGDDEDPPISA